jgi:hypothetical protein
MSPDEENIFTITWKRRLLKKKDKRKYEALGSPLIKQGDELDSFTVARQLDCGSTRLTPSGAR